MEPVPADGDPRTPPNAAEEDRRADALDVARVRAVYAVLGLIIVFAGVDIATPANMDLGVFATLMGGLLGLLGLGAVVRFVGMK